MNEAHLLQAWRLVQAGNLDAAARLYREVLRVTPSSFEALAGLGLAYLQGGNAEGRAADPREAARLNGGFAGGVLQSRLRVADSWTQRGRSLVLRAGTRLAS